MVLHSVNKITIIIIGVLILGCKSDRKPDNNCKGCDYESVKLDSDTSLLKFKLMDNQFIFDKDYQNCNIIIDVNRKNKFIERVNNKLKLSKLSSSTYSYIFRDTIFADCNYKVKIIDSLTNGIKLNKKISDIILFNKSTFNGKILSLKSYKIGDTIIKENHFEMWWGK